MTSQEFRDRFLESNDRFQAAMLEAIREHQKGVVAFTDAARGFDALETRVGDLQESVDELKVLIMEQGEQLKALRARLDNGGEQP